MPKLTIILCIKVKKNAKLRYRYNQVPHLTRDTIWEGDQNTKKRHARDIPIGDHKAAKNGQDSIIKTNMKYK